MRAVMHLGREDAQDAAVTSKQMPMASTVLVSPRRQMQSALR